MKDGVYKLVFDKNLIRKDKCHAVVVVRDSIISGCDSAFSFHGEITGGTVRLKGKRNNHRKSDWFDGKGDIELQLTLIPLSTHILFSGHHIGQPHLTFSGEIHVLGNFQLK